MMACDAFRAWAAQQRAPNRCVPGRRALSRLPRVRIVTKIGLS